MIVHLKTISAIVVVGFLIGCANRRNLREMDCCAEIPAGHIPVPAGQKLCQWQTAQVANAAMDQRVLYRSNFVGNTKRLSTQAIEHLRREVYSGSDALPWIVEPSYNDELDAARIAVVIDTLSEMGVAPVVTLATPAAIGLRGPQAEQAAASLSRSVNRTGGSSTLSTGANIGSGRGTY